MAKERPLVERESRYEPAVPSSLDKVHIELSLFWADVNSVLNTGIAERWKIEFETGFAEICANIIKHAFADSPLPGTMTLRLRLFEDRIESEITDDGSKFEEKNNEGDADVADLAESGRGLRVARSLLDNLDYRRSQESKNHWLLVKYLA